MLYGICHIKLVTRNILDSFSMHSPVRTPKEQYRWITLSANELMTRPRVAMLPPSIATGRHPYLLVKRPDNVPEHIMKKISMTDNIIIAIFIYK